MTAPGGEVVVGFEVPEFGTGRTVFALRPGLRMSCEVVLLIDGVPRRVSVMLDVVGSVCPDPSEHAKACDETDHDSHGDCDGDVRLYIARAPVAGKRPGDDVLLCASHAQQHGRHIRKVTR